MRVVWVGGYFPADKAHLDTLSEQVDITVYGATNARSDLPFQPEPPSSCRSRVFQPVVSAKPLLYVYRGLSAALDADSPNVIHVVSEPWGTLAIQCARWVSRHPDTALVVHGCDTIWWHGPRVEQVARRRLATMTLRRCAAYAAESSVAISRARESGLGSLKPSAVIHTNPRDPLAFAPPKSPGAQLNAQRSLGLPTGGVGVGFIGRLVPEKGPTLLLDAFRVAEDQLEGVWLALAGSGDLERDVRKRADDENHRFLGALSYPDQVAEFYRSIDILVVPSWRTPDWEEQSPRSVIEGLLSGCTVVGADSGAIPEMLGGHGIVFPERDPRALSKAILRAVAEHGRRKAGREWAISRYSAGAVAQQLLALWTQARRAPSTGDAENLSSV